MKIMFSQPMRGLSEEEIIETRDRVTEKLQNEGYEVINTYFDDEWYSEKAMKSRGVRQIPICYLAKSLENMSLCDAVYFCKGWDKARGCKLEHNTAVAYGVTIIYEED